jgi:hypothetical protein
MHLLLAAGADPNARDGYALLMATGMDEPIAVQVLLNAGVCNISSALELTRCHDCRHTQPLLEAYLRQFSGSAKD